MSIVFNKLKRLVFCRLYYGIRIHLKSSVQSESAKKIRYWLAKEFVKQCGTNVNFEKGAKFNPELSIGNNSGMGANCVISGAGSVVTKDIPDYAIVGGSPARVIRMRNEGRP